MRRKFRLLFKNAYKYTKEIRITDKTYRTLLNPQEVQQTASKGKISQDKAGVIVENADFFMLPHWDGNEKNTRSK